MKINWFLIFMVIFLTLGTTILMWGTIVIGYPFGVLSALPLAIMSYTVALFAGYEYRQDKIKEAKQP
jgi:hypothetical protein